MQNGIVQHKPKSVFYCDPLVRSKNHCYSDMLVLYSNFLFLPKYCSLAIVWLFIKQNGRAICTILNLHCICMSHIIRDSRKTGCLHNSTALVRLVGHLSHAIKNHIGALFSICITFENNVWLQHLQLRCRSIISDSFTDSPIHLRLHCSSGLQLHLKRKPCTSLPY